MRKNSQLYVTAFLEFEKVEEQISNLQPHKFLEFPGDVRHREFVHALTMQNEYAINCLHQIVALKPYWTSLSLGKLVSYRRAISEICFLIKSNEDGIDALNTDNPESLTEKAEYLRRESLISAVENCKNDLLNAHYISLLPVEPTEFQNSIGSVIDQYYARKNLDSDLGDKMRSCADLIQQIDRRLVAGRELMQTKEIKTIGEVYEKDSKAKTKIFKVTISAAIATLLAVPALVHGIALLSGIKHGVFSSQHPTILAVTATLTFAISGILFKLSWTYFQQKTLLESRHKLCLVLNDFLDNFRGEVDRGEIVRMIAYALFMDNAPTNASISDVSAMATAINALASPIRGNKKD